MVITHCHFIYSSRSHSIFTMTVTMNDAQGDMRLGKLHLVCLFYLDIYLFQ
jgi:hypothetical protein